MNNVMQESQRLAGPPELHRPGADGLVLATTKIEGRTTFADQHLSLVFDAGTEMVCARSIHENLTVRVLGRTICDALHDLHVPRGAIVQVNTTSGRDARELPDAVRRASGRIVEVRQIGWNGADRFDSAAMAIARSLSVACEYEAAMGWADLASPEQRQMFVEAILEQVLYWHHRGSNRAHGMGSPIDRHAARPWAVGGEV